MAHFFKYVTANTGKLILKNRSLRWSTPALLNDPFDIQFLLQLRCDLKRVRALALEKSWQHHDGQLLDKPLNEVGRIVRFARANYAHTPRDRAEFEKDEAPTIDECIAKTIIGVPRFAAELVQTHFANPKIFCLSDLATSIPMWSYYAQNHAGIVLRFTDDTFNNPLKHARRVKYVEHMLSIFDDDSFSDFLAGYGNVEPREIMDAIIYTKSRQWAHEHEWRVYSGDGRMPSAPYEDCPFGENELDGIIFGLRTAENDRMAMIRTIRDEYQHVELLQATANRNEYEITISQYRRPPRDGSPRR